MPFFVMWACGVIAERSCVLGLKGGLQRAAEAGMQIGFTVGKGRHVRTMHISYREYVCSSGLDLAGKYINGVSDFHVWLHARAAGGEVMVVVHECVRVSHCGY